VLGDTFSASVKVQSGASICISPLQNLKGKQLLMRLRGQVTCANQTKIRSFQLYRAPTSPLALRFHIRLLGCIGKEQICIAEHFLVQPLDQISGRSHADYTFVSVVEILVEKTFSNHALHVAAQARHCEDGPNNFNADEAPSKMRITLTLSTGLKIRDVRRYSDCSLRNPHLHII
jgi:hypothetical protein